MVKIVFYEWSSGMAKISFTRLLSEKAGLGLSEAKQLKDRLTSGEVIEVFVDNEGLAREIILLAEELNVKGRIG